jgi:hypothetical protein
MDTFKTEITIREEGELHLDHLPFHAGDRVQVIVAPASEDKRGRQAEYDAFMKGYADEDSIYDKP